VGAGLSTRYTGSLEGGKQPLVIWILAAVFIVLVIVIGVAAAQDPEAGLSNKDLPQLIVPKEAFLDPLQAEVYRVLAPALAQEGFLLFPKVRLETVYDPGRLAQTGWHRMRQSLVDFVAVRAADFRPAGLILLETPDGLHYLEAENADLKESAIAESGLPLLKLDLDPDQPLGEAADSMRLWVRTVLAPAYSVGNSTQVDLL